MPNAAIAVVLFATSLLALMMGLWVIFDAPLRRLNQLFFLLCMSVSGWTAIIGSSELLFIEGLDRGLPSIGSGYLFGALIPFFFYQVCKAFHPRKPSKGVLVYILAFWCIALIYLAFHGGIVRRLYITPHSHYYSFETGWAFPIFLIYVVCMALLSAREIALNYRTASNRFARLQFFYFSAGAGASFAIAIMCNLLLPAMGIYSFSPYGAASPLIALGAISVATTRHRLLDLRISFRVSSTIAIWLIFGIVISGVYVFLQRSLSLNAFWYNTVFIIGFGMWSMILYCLSRASESLVRNGGDRAFVYKSTLDALTQSLIGLTSRHEIGNIATTYLNENHSLGAAYLWSRSSSGRYELLSGTVVCESLESYSSYFESIDFTDLLGELIDLDKDRLLLPTPPSELTLRAIIVLPLMPPKIHLISFSDSHRQPLDPLDLDLICSFSKHVAAAIKAAIQMEEIAVLNIALAGAKDSLLSYNEALEKSTQARNDILANKITGLQELMEVIVHDTSNHLNVISLDLKYGRPPVASEIVESLDGVTRQLNRISSFISIDSQEHIAARCNLDELLTEVLSETASITSTKHIQISRSELFDIWQDKDLVRIVLSNVLSNAVKYVGDKSNPCIRISGTMNGDGCTILVEDNGIGILSREIERIFRPLYRGSRQSIGQLVVPGTGMGLSIAYRLLEKINGRISVRSEVSVGTTVSVYLPSLRTSMRTEIAR